MSGSSRRRYAVVGTGHRAQMYIDAIIGDHSDVAELVAWCEPNPGRAQYYDRHLVSHGLTGLPWYEPADLEVMIADERVDRVIVTSPDYTHAEMVSRSLLAGADVVVEKPLTIDAAGTRRINDAISSSGKEVVMTFNYRYSPRNSALREVIASGQIGAVTAVHFEWVLDTVHGADYFRRWHRQRENSGGLWIHKSAHHFDLVNWWINDSPESVYARAGLKFYGTSGAGASQALQPRPDRGINADPRDPWALDINKDPRLRELYVESEKHDGYIRDQDVFAPGISIDDTIAVLVDYRGGPFLTYSLVAYSPWEGYRVSVSGTKGRAELEVVERGAVEFDPAEGAVLDPSAKASTDSDELRPKRERLLVQQHWQAAREVEIPSGSGSHGGGDAILLRDVFEGPGEDPLARPAGYLDGVEAIAVGIAANQSIATGGPVAIDDLELGGLTQGGGHVSR